MKQFLDNKSLLLSKELKIQKAAPFWSKVQMNIQFLWLNKQQEMALDP